MNREPVAVRTALVTFVAALVRLLVLLKVIELDPAAEVAIVTTVDLAAGLALVFLIRPKVTPVDAPVLTVPQLDGLTVDAAEGEFYSIENLPPAGTDRVPGPDHRLGDETP